MMHHYLIIANIERAQGTETWEVNAENESEALRLHEEGLSSFVDQELEATEFGSLEVILDD